MPGAGSPVEKQQMLCGHSRGGDIHLGWDSRLSWTKWRLDDGKEGREGNERGLLQGQADSDPHGSGHLGTEGNGEVGGPFLQKIQYPRYLISQNVDGIVPRSGFPLNRLAELHGNVFCEQCDRCGTRSYLDVPVGTVGLKPTGRSCPGTATGKSCRGKMIDSVLDWEDALPEPDYSTSVAFAKVCPLFPFKIKNPIKNADLILCLGTSLQIVPVGNMPLYAKKKGMKVVTVNLQATKHVGFRKLILI